MFSQRAIKAVDSFGGVYTVLLPAKDACGRSLQVSDASLMARF